MVAVRRFVEGFNADDADLVQSACTDAISIIDDFPPHQWLGTGATTRWYRDMAEWATGYDMADWSVLLGEPRHVTVSGADAYLVVLFAARWLEEGQPAERKGSLAVALRENVQQWRVCALAWTWD